MADAVGSRGPGSPGSAGSRSQAVVVDSWSASGVKVTDVVDALADLRDQSNGHHSSARTAVLTVVAVAPADDQAYGVAETFLALAGHHPARIVVLRPDPDSVASLSARATLYARENDHHGINFEEVHLHIGGQAAKHLDSLVEAFTLSDLPVAVWYVGSIPEAADPLLTVADAVLIDSRDAPEAGQLRSLLQLARRRTVMDLSWSRLTPWRELLAGLFDPPAQRRWLNSIDSIEIAGKVGPRRLLGGWLVAQTGISPRQVTLTDARHVSVHMTAHRDGLEATFAVERVEGQRLVSAEAAVEDVPVVRATTALPDDPVATSLAAALTHLRPDRIWERALSSATALEVE